MVTVLRASSWSALPSEAAQPTLVVFEFQSRHDKEAVAQVVPDRRVRGNLAGIALVFAELVGRRVEWDRGLEGFDMTESQVVNEWISQGEARGKLTQQRQKPQMQRIFADLVFV